MNSAVETVAALKSGGKTAVEVMDATYDQIESWNPHVNALVSLLSREEARALAAEADQSDDKGPLHGLPLAVKDLANAAGFVTTMGSPLLAGSKPAKADDIMVARMRAAGAIVIGKTNTPEFGLGSHTFNPVHGTTRNPWDFNRTCGGSSGGAAVALATGMLSIADGSDMMGSLRNPAGWNGCYGLRPSWGAVPSEPLGDTFLHQLSTNGPMARNPADLALLLSVQAGGDPRQPHTTPLAEASGKRPRRIGWLADWGGAFPMEDGILALCEEALKVFEYLGHEVVALSAGFSSEALWESWTSLRSWQVAMGLTAIEAMPGGRDALKETAIWELDRGRAMSGTDIHRASLTRSQWFAQAAQLFEDVDVLVLPTAQCWPFDMETEYPRDIAGQQMDSYHRWMEVMIPASLIGLPALAVPAGFGAAGLPMGLQLMGPRGSDFDLLSLAETYHTAAAWAGAAPVLPEK